ncbi:TetR/AcrR family transcriptional regulator [Hyphomicrobium sp. NDB2Meth4]|uniref:TetR/AcrR family transcriptional regulator n=1 Tax=Hyphomicrobium sp. NDB2Meth4 TaxID=1892846 RepID=UPI000931E728|nr:TetR/AcrR family transcriptional regulator [Hyphomicrobium sp. NDB2Meth4]
MGRRSIHTPEELRELIIDATTTIVEQEGLEGLSAREIAKRIGYSPGTLYNVFENLDDLLLIIEARLLDELALRLEGTDTSGSPSERLRRLVGTYFAFTQERPKLWNLLNEHRMPAGRTVPEWYQAKLDKLLAPLDEAMTPLLLDSDPSTRRQHARTLWASVHGMTSISTADKLSHVTAHIGRSLVDDLVQTYLAGLEKRTPARSAHS